MSEKFIAEQLHVNPNTIYREVKRNSSKRFLYRANKAQILCDESKERYGRSRTFNNSQKLKIINWLSKEQ